MKEQYTENTEEEENEEKEKDQFDHLDYLDPWQLEFLQTEGDKILCTGRQVGKSTVCSIDAGEYAINNPKSKPIVMIAPTERQAYALFDKTLNYLSQYYPERVIRKGRDRPTKQRIKLRNGVEIYCLPVGTSGIGIRFLTIGRLYVDEASRMPEEVWAAVDPALLTTGGSTILISTPFGARGRFYETWVNQDKAYESFSRFSIDSENVIRNREFGQYWTEVQREKALQKIEQAKNRMSKRAYAEEYLGEFIEDLHRYFSDELIEKCCTIKRPKVFSKHARYYLGVDIARMGEDEGTYEIIRKDSSEKLVHVENIVTRKKLTTDTERKILELDKQYNFREIYIDAGSGSLGVGIYDHLLENDQTKRKIVAINNRARPMDRDGTKKQRIAKEDLYINLLALMEQGKIKLLDDDEVKESLRSVQYEYVQKEGELTKLRIFGTYTHIVEGIIRAAWCVHGKDLNIWIRSIRT